jgi:hypothetical protein
MTDFVQQGRKVASALARAVSVVPIIEASNIGEYYFEHVMENDPINNPPARPPFDWCFVEFRQPESLSRRILLDPRAFPLSWGFLVQMHEIPEEEGLDPFRWRMSLTCVKEWPNPDDSKAETVIQGPIYEIDILLKENYEPGPYRLYAYLLDSLNEEETEWLEQDSRIFAGPVTLAWSFMSCKSVAVQVVNPDLQRNRERRKAGLKPFLRYHTINIEPMKTILRTEGNIETVGLKRALHICRGHFSTYSEERPLFGKVAGTFWIPAHVRGSAKQGVVVSDYNVNAPKGP